MRRWDALVDGYIRATRARGLAETTIQSYHTELQRFGCWLKRRKPKPKLEEVNSDLVIRYIRSRTTFRAKSMVASVMTPLRMMGDYLVREGYWHGNPLRWMRGPKLDPRMKLPCRIGGQRQLHFPIALTQGLCYRVIIVASLNCYRNLEVNNGAENRQRNAGRVG